MAKLLLGKEVTDALNANLQTRTAALREKGIIPTLGIVRVGADPSASAFADRNIPENPMTVRTATMRNRTMLLNLLRILTSRSLVCGNPPFLCELRASHPPECPPDGGNINIKSAG